MRLLLVLGVLGVAVSAWLAPRHYRERPPTPPLRRLQIEDPRERAAYGEEHRSLGLALSAYQELYERDRSDMDALRGLVRTGLLLGATAHGQPQLEQLVRSTIKDYLERREEVDPDGRFLQEVVREWLRMRREHHFWLARAAVAIYEAGQGRPGAIEVLLELARRGPFHFEFFSYAQRFHPAWRGVEPMVRHYLDAGDLEGRVHAGTTLLIYHTLYGVGEELLDRYRVALRNAFLEFKSSLHPDQEGDERYGAGFFGLAMLGGEAEVGVVAKARRLDYPRIAHALEVARVWAGLEPPDKYGPGSRGWSFLAETPRLLLFRAACLRYARLIRDTEGTKPSASVQQRLDDLRSFVEAGLDSPDQLIALECFRTLTTLEPGASEVLAEQMAARPGLVRLIAALSLPAERRPPLVVPFLASADPGTATLAAVLLADPDAPLPIQMPAR